MRGIVMICALMSASLAIDEAFASQKRLYRGQAQTGRIAPAGPADDGYFSNYLTGPGGTRTPIMDYPGSATVITRKMMDDINARNICDALRYAPGVTVSGCW